MSQYIREQIDKIRNWGTPIMESKQIDYTKNQKRLREYIKILKNDYENGIVKDEGGDYNNYDTYISYFIILHNFLSLENKFIDEVKLSNKEINRYLNLPKLSNPQDIIDKFKELYDVNSKVRFALETFDSIEPIRKIRSELPNNMGQKIYKDF